MKKSGFHRRPGCQVQKFGYVVASFVIQDNQMSEKAKKRVSMICIGKTKPTSEKGILVLIRQDCVLVNYVTSFFTSDSDFFLFFQKKWVGRTISVQTLIQSNLY